MKTILFPTDISDNHTIALNYLRLLARGWKARVVVVHVYQPLISASALPTFNDPTLATPAFDTLGSATTELELESISQQHLNRFVDELQAEGLDAVGDWRMGTVDDEVVEAARQYQPDLLITHRTPAAGFFDRLAGSSADDIARAAPCPVLYIPETTRKEPHIRSVVYVLQQNITQQTVSAQTDFIVDTFDAHLTVVPPEDIDDYKPDLYIIQRRDIGFLDGLLSSDPTEKLLSDSKAPVLVHHELK
ncbi:universal stress protein [Fibrella sp. WM1]|uniref:universal stress protein n=1 Tax=Fibrella musci TaxID=3242485 RepID=UPI00351FC1E2